MRYLYGDSVPFPPQYDFLAALDVFCTQAARLVTIHGESTRTRKTTEEAAAARARSVDDLDAFHKEAIGALQDGARSQAQPLVDGYVAQLSDLAFRVVDDARRTATMTSEREQQAARAELDRRRIESRDALEKILVAVRLPPESTEVRMSLGPGPASEFSGVFTFQGGLVAVITLAGQAVDEWKGPRRVGDLAQGLALPVGVRRSLFKRTVAPETITLDDYILGGFDLKDDRAELRLRKKVELADSLVFDVRRGEDRVLAEVHYPEDAEAESGLPAALDVPSAQEMERLWQLVRTACRPLLAQRRQLVSLKLGGVDVFEADKETEVVRLIISAIAPVVGEVARRSPNANELSLKVENDSGRREEIYLRKAQLVDALSAVALPERDVFAPLGLLPSDSDSVDVLLEGVASPG